jgi:hypothetical protein
MGFEKYEGGDTAERQTRRGRKPKSQKIEKNGDLGFEAMAMKSVTEFEVSRGCLVDDVSEKELGYDIRSMHSQTGELRLTEVKGIGGKTGNIPLTPNERRVAEDRRDCYWLYVVTNCDEQPTLQEPIPDPARFDWHPVTKVDHYYLSVDAMTQPMMVREEILHMGKASNRNIV